MTHLKTNDTFEEIGRIKGLKSFIFDSSCPHPTTNLDWSKLFCTKGETLEIIKLWTYGINEFKTLSLQTISNHCPNLKKLTVRSSDKNHTFTHK